ncbi:MAG: AMP-binding protein [Flavobacteriaceae bacterium]|nr:AMP-binding protein [Flavobacteriaceae bacterium]
MYSPNDLVHQNFKLNGKKFWEDHHDLNFLLEFVFDQISFQDLELERFLQQWIHHASINLSSSGTTAEPKLLQVDKKYLLHSVKMTAKFFSLKTLDKALHCLPIKYIAGKMQLIRALHLGLDLEMVQPTSKPLVNSKYYDFATMTSQQLTLSLDHISNIQTLLIGGGLLSQETQKKAKKIHSNVYESFGMTETLSHMAIRKLEDPIGVFTILPKVSISVDNRSCLIITAKHLGINQLVTNDIVEILNDRQFRYLGRIDHVINSGGIKIFPEKIEETLSSAIDTPFFITSVKDHVLGQRVVLVMEQHEKRLSQTSIRSIMKKLPISNYQKPKEFIVFENFIRTPTDKIKRHQTLNQKPLALLHL